MNADTSTTSVHLKEFLEASEAEAEETPAEAEAGEPTPAASSYAAFEMVGTVRMNVGKLVPGLLVRMSPGDPDLWLVRSSTDARAHCTKVRPSDRARISDSQYVYLDRPESVPGAAESTGTNIASRSFVEIVDPDALGDAFARKAARDRLIKGKPVPIYSESTTREVNMGAVGLPVAGAGKAKAAKVRLERGKAAGSKANGKANGAVRTSAGRAPRNGEAKETRACACGCGGSSGGYFVPGHDARYKGWIKRLSDGRITKDGKDASSGEKVVPAAVLTAMSLKKRGEGFAPSVHYNGEKL